MTVAELIAHLQTFPQDLPVARRLYSEQIMMEPDDMKVTELCFPRVDGWIQNERPDLPLRPYLLFDGN